MLPNTYHFNRRSARTHRGERPDKMRHPQSCNSTDVMEGFEMPTNQFDDTTSALNCKPYRHQINANFTSTVKLLSEWLVVDLFAFYISYLVSLCRRGEIRAGTHRMCDHGRPLSYSINLQRKESSMSARVPAIMLVLFVLAASQPVLLLQRLLISGAALLKFFGG